MLDALSTFGSAIGETLLRWMKHIVCAVVYWVLYWITPWLEGALYYVPSWLSAMPAKVTDGLTLLWKITDVFLPVSETVPVLLGYWVMLLAFRIYATVNQTRMV